MRTDEVVYDWAAGIQAPDIHSRPSLPWLRHRYTALDRLFGPDGKLA
jgi:hypothetical protein